jgi:hypothetical protein
MEYTVAITEKWNLHARIRQNLFGFIDLAAGWQVSVHGWSKNANGKWVLREGVIGK